MSRMIVIIVLFFSPRATPTRPSLPSRAQRRQRSRRSADQDHTARGAKNLTHPPHPWVDDYNCKTYLYFTCSHTLLVLYVRTAGQERERESQFPHLCECWTNQMSSRVNCWHLTRSLIGRLSGLVSVVYLYLVESCVVCGWTGEGHSTASAFEY